MAALSPRDANAYIAQKPIKQVAINSKIKPASAKPATLKAPVKGKDHPPPPPPEVYEPPSSDRRNGAMYHTGKLLGKGGFAICYEGQLAETKQIVALKIVLSKMPQKKMEQKFQTELQIHSKMKHTNIVQFHRAFSFQHSTYIVLELCPNGSLMDMVKKRRFVTEPEVRYWTIQMAGAIKYMHAKGIIHRDLKMGNIFLDKDMNIKVGDFGLAAMLLSNKDMTTIRRTTLCGTPNYIAPEILEKGKQGHDQAVDIWSLGIIIFAMLTGKPPFQSDTQDEIYRRAREREYDWPSLDTSDNVIGQEAKDLVADLLQDPSQRPAPDLIVQHSFFISGYFPKPEDMTYKLRIQHPDVKQFQSVGRRSGRGGTYAKCHEAACVKSDVGPLSSTKAIKGSVYREVCSEEKAGLTPQVPLPENMVYRPFEEMFNEGLLINARNLEFSASNSEQGSMLPPNPIRAASTLGRSSATQNFQSFAAQQRSQGQIPGAAAMPRALMTRQDVNGEMRSYDQDRLSDPPKRKISASNSLPKRSQKSRKELPTPVEEEERVPENPLQVQARLGADMAQQLNQARVERKIREDKQSANQLDRPLSLFSPDDKIERFPQSRPDQVLNSVKTFHAELERALNSRSLANVRQGPENPPVLVVKWVDYTNKFGLGYILSNGSVGCIFNKQPSASGTKTGYIPPSAVIIPDSERHLMSRENAKYVDNGQMIPITNGKSVEFYEHNGEEGILRVKVDPRQFHMDISSDGKTATMPRLVDEHDERKRQKIVLWKKFANYMISFGRDSEYTPDPNNVETPASSEADVVTFYQRFGDVGCWLFCDGHYQFNFPDHTKIILSADGTWCDFYHLPLEAARDLAQNRSLPHDALDERTKLSFPLQTLLNFAVKPQSARSRAGTSRTMKPVIDPLLQGIPAANDFRRKVEFIRKIVGEWLINDGVGRSDMSVEGRLRWAGYRDVSVKAPFKHVWATVCARGGDDRKVAWFDPKRADEIVPDIEN